MDGLFTVSDIILLGIAYLIIGKVAGGAAFDVLRTRDTPSEDVWIDYLCVLLATIAWPIIAIVIVVNALKGAKHE